MRRIIVVIAIFATMSLQAQLKTSVGKPDFSDWQGISKVSKNEAVFNSGETIQYRYPEGKTYNTGFRKFYGNASNWNIYKGLSFEVYLKSATSAKIDISLKVAEEDADDLNPISKATVQIQGKGWQSVYVPWEILDTNKGQVEGTLQGIKELNIVANVANSSKLKIRNVNITKGQCISLSAPIQGKSVVAGGKLSYEFEIGNTTDQKQMVQLSIPKMGWESMKTKLNPEFVELAPNEVKKCQLVVELAASMPQGSREKLLIKAIANGNGASATTLEFISAVAVPYPNIVFSADKWQEVKDKIVKYDWAKEGLAEYERRATKWKVPEIAAELSNANAYMGRNLFRSEEGDEVMNCAIAYQLTSKNEYAKKCALFIRRLINVENGYPTTLRANNINFVKEGGFFQNVARAYDMVYHSGLFTDQDRKLVENTFRLYIETAQMGNATGGIGNWDVAELTGALYCALVIQDWHLAENILYRPTGIYGQFAQGVMSDGWWYECAVGYNIWVASEFSEIAIALQPWGINFKDQQIPIGTTKHYSLMPNRIKPGLYGMDFMKWGTINKNAVGVKDMWDAVVPMLDYRGVLPAVNDAKEDQVAGEPFELAYYLYQDPEYAVIINRSKKRSLLYGVPNLPDVVSEKAKQSTFADNIGVVQLRTQTKGREQREQIQAALHYGSHGGYHGHFDRTNFLSMMRYGRSFYNPEMFWYGYSSYLYKFLVQTSINKNMVVVDQKMQEPKESFKTLYYTGDMMQATVVETNTRWSNPPYGGMRYGDEQGISFEQKTMLDNRSIFVPKNAPNYGECTDYTEPVLQRRLMVMMDDYVVLADYMKAEKEHIYDWLFQIKGFKEITANKKEFIRHDNQMNTDPLSSAQFITDCNWIKTVGNSRAKFEMCWGKGCDIEGGRLPFSEDGPLKIDIFNAWPLQNEIMIGTAPESFGVNKRLWYTVKADNQVLVSDSTGAWILGSKDILLNVKGKKELVLTTKTSKPENNTIFWGDAKLILSDGSEVYLSTLPVKYKNLAMPAAKGKDYYNGPIKIAGELMENSMPGMPEKQNERAEITIDLSGLNAVSFKAKLGGDFPLGDESARRKTIAVRSKGKDAHYLSVIEPYETKSVIKSVTAKSATVLVVELLDGRVQEITLSGFDGDGKSMQVSTKEFVNGSLVREENTH
ncbi:hypothetical protein ADIARSV_2920 [Arcticibacter svalbardensis MN12-7]|uniref:Alginate lyase domain-containing protein n=1 Tax=Arcticibacter svalbardensis MN12-7 TaxID=1150600 RepID=R9GQ08_9SPHI|nr:hypothetical protein [Arcticibacter svalbardensis]EOR93927.1 hypothetical protein ADIARSV_2920 [Arcticibacter svalbardensis MN12-7]